MRRVRFARGVIVACAVVFVLVAATPARADHITYDYQGLPFTFCGFGCPGQPGSEVAPANWNEDFIIASLTFSAPLAPNLTFDDDVRAGLVAFSITDAFGSFFMSGSTLPDVVDDDDGVEVTFPGLVLATDAAGNIVRYFMAVKGLSEAGVSNPPLFCAECGNVNIADFVAVNIGLDDSLEWDAFSSEPGRWQLRTAAVPEPATLALGAVALAGFAVRNRRRRSRER